MGEPQIRAAVLRRVDGLEVPLEQTVPMSSGRVSPVSISGESYQKAAVSISLVSRTTSQSRFASARRCSEELAEPTTGF
jgi:hypothetical protein